MKYENTEILNQIKDSIESIDNSICLLINKTFCKEDYYRPPCLRNKKLIYNVELHQGGIVSTDEQFNTTDSSHKKILPETLEHITFFDYLCIKAKIFTLQNLLSIFLIFYSQCLNDFVDFDKISTVINSGESIFNLTSIDYNLLKADKTKYKLKKKLNTLFSTKSNIYGNTNYYKDFLESFIDSLQPYKADNFINKDISVVYFGDFKAIPKIYCDYFSTIFDLIARKEVNYLTNCNDFLKISPLEIPKLSSKNFQRMLDKYNEALEGVNYKIGKSKNTKSEYSVNLMKARYINYLYLIDNIFASDFFSSLDSYTIRNHINNIDFIQQLTLMENNKMPSETANYENIEFIYSLSLLEMLLTFNIDGNRIDDFIKNEISSKTNLNNHLSENELIEISLISNYEKLVYEREVYMNLTLFFYRSLTNLIDTKTYIINTIYENFDINHANDHKELYEELINDIYKLLKPYYDIDQLPSTNAINPKQITNIYPSLNNHLTLAYLFRYPANKRAFDDRFRNIKNGK